MNQPPTEVASSHPPTEVASSHPPTYVAPYPPTYVPPRQPATDPPWQQVRDLAPPQSEADASHQPATIMVPRLPQADAPPPDAPPPEPARYFPPPQQPPDAAPPEPPREVLHYGPGVPASQAGAESVWRTGRPPELPPRQRRLRRLRRLLGSALTVILLATAGVVLYLRFFDHPPFHVTGVRIVHQTRTGCTVDVTGRIATNGAAGTVSYQWVFQPQIQPPQPLNHSVIAGQHAVYVTVAVEGRGHGSTTQRVTLDVLGPDTGTDFTDVTISC